jgi:tRNA-guanine family transglycosylase
MEFYVSWSHSDPLYQLYDKRCSMLVSITAVSHIWQLSRFPKLPYHIMLDSGSYSYISNNLPLPTPKAIFHRQLRILDGLTIPAIICTVDHPILNKSMSLTEKNRAIDKTIGNAWELKALVAEYYKSGNFDKQRQNYIKPLAVVQGYDLASLKYCARQLQAMGHNLFGIGSMAHLYNTKEIVHRVEAVQSIVGKPVHVFGISAIETMKRLREISVASVDSARPIKSAVYNAILYSEPFQRFGIAGSNFRSGETKFSPERLVNELSLACPCPVCNNSINNDILKLGVRKYLLLRAVHNYYHIKKTIVGWNEENSWKAQKDDRIFSK